MIQTEKEIKIAQINALSKRLKELLGHRLRNHSFDFKDIIEAIKRQKIETDSFSVLIATDTYCTAYATQYKHYKKLNPLVWFLYFEMEDQPIFTINFFYKIFFPEVRILQPEKGTKINIQYDREYTAYTEDTESRIVDNGTGRFHGIGRRVRPVLGRGQKNRPHQIDP